MDSKRRKAMACAQKQLEKAGTVPEKKEQHVRLAEFYFWYAGQIKRHSEDERHIFEQMVKKYAPPQRMPNLRAIERA